MKLAQSALWMLLAVSVSSYAAQSAQQRQRAFAKLPDWTGLWIPDDGIMNNIHLSTRADEGSPGLDKLIMNAHPPYNAEWEARYQAARQGQSGLPEVKECGMYFPGVMESPSEFEALLTPEQTVLVFAAREIRHIYSDGRSHPPEDELWPMPWGDSVGHWEGETLVVDTVSVAKQVGPYSPMMSDKVRFKERIRLVGKDKLEDQMTFLDPVALTRPWTITIPYKRVTEINRLIHGDCLENDRTPIVDGKLTVTSP